MSTEQGTESAKALTLRIVYAKETKKITLEDSKTVQDLKQAVEKETGCSVEQMKLMYKGLLAAPGKPELDHKALSDAGLKNNAKILVVGATKSQVEEVTKADQVSTTAAFKAQANATPTKKKWSEERPHKEIIAKGPPADAPLAYRPGQDPLPDGPLAGLVGDGGRKARLHIKTSSNKLIIYYPDTSREFSLSSIQRVTTEPIPGREEYHIVGFKMGRRTTIFLYWVPAQLISAIKGAVLGYGV